MESSACRRRASDAEQSAPYSVPVEYKPVKEEPEWGECGVSEAAVAEGLYADHEIKDELVIGPELVQQQDIAFSMQNAEYIGRFSRLFIFELWLSTSGSDADRKRQVLQQLINMVPDVESVDTSNLDKVINYICQRLVVIWRSSSRTKSTVLKKYSKWLNKIESVKLTKRSGLMNDMSCVKSDQLLSFELPKKEFGAYSKQSKRRRLAELDESAVSNLMETSDPSSEVNPNDVLSLITEAKLTKRQYLLLRKFINSRTNPVLPEYRKVVEAKKKC